MLDGNNIIEWQAGALVVVLRIGKDDEVVYLQSISTRGQPSAAIATRFFDDALLPLTEVRLAGAGNAFNKSSKALIGSSVSRSLKYKHHQTLLQSDGTHRLDITSQDPTSGVSVTATLQTYRDIPVLRAHTSIQNTSSSRIIVTQLTSLVIGGVSASSKHWWHDFTLCTANNSWYREAQWRESRLPDLGIDDIGLQELPGSRLATHATYSLSSRGTFSTATYLPMGMLKNTRTPETWLWQVEPNGSWRWEIGDWKDSLYLAAGGPTRYDHNWILKLEPGASFESVPVAVTHVLDTADAAFAHLTQYRRAMRRHHADNEKMSLIFNDYMNCLMGDPNEDKIKALIEPVTKAGAEYFVIDAGWYADDSIWWDDVGAWAPSKARFPSGFDKLLASIHSNGLIPGLWIEPEVVGIRSSVAHELPDDAFFTDHGARVVEKRRYQLDFSHPAVVERMDGIIDHLVAAYRVGYFKFDYNIHVVQGTDSRDTNAEVASLQHSRAYLAWVNRLYDRHPDLVIESCSSGAQRLDYAMLATHSLQSTSDQQDPVRYAAIAAAMPSAVTPEQSASWAYPQRSWSHETNALTVVNSLLGRVHLSGRLDQLEPEQLDLIISGMKLYKEIRRDLKTGLPFWPLGLPKWHDKWIALGIGATDKKICYVSVWRRDRIGSGPAWGSGVGGSGFGGDEATSSSSSTAAAAAAVEADKGECILPIRPFLQHLRAQSTNSMDPATLSPPRFEKKHASVDVEVLYPRGEHFDDKTRVHWEEASGSVKVWVKSEVCARLLCVSYN